MTHTDGFPPLAAGNWEVGWRGGVRLLGVEHALMSVISPKLISWNYTNNAVAVRAPLRAELHIMFILF